MDHGGCPYNHSVRGKRIVGKSAPTEADTKTRRIQQRILGSCEIGPKVGPVHGLAMVRRRLHDDLVSHCVAHTYHVSKAGTQS